MTNDAFLLFPGDPEWIGRINFDSYPRLSHPLGGTHAIHTPPYDSTDLPTPVMKANTTTYRASILSSSLCTVLLTIGLLFGGLNVKDASAQIISAADKPKVQAAPTAVLLPDLIPVLFSHTFEEIDGGFRRYDFSLLVINNSPAQSGSVAVAIGMHVLASSDQTKYPVGMKVYNGYGLTYSPLPGYSTDMVYGGFNIPVEVTKCEIYVIVDRLMEHLDDHWENDTGDMLRGRVNESNENNNILGPILFQFNKLVSTTPPFVMK